MSKSITEQEVTQRMMSSWTLELANWLVNEKDLERREAFLKAHLVRRLLDGLGQGVVVFQYRKERTENGEV